MGRTIVKIKDLYFEWSSVWDRPITTGMTLEEFQAHIKEEYGRQGLNALPERLKRVEEKGHSDIISPDLESFLVCNRAGPDETWIAAEEIYERYAEETEDEVR